HAARLVPAGEHHTLRRGLDAAGDLVGRDPRLSLISALTHLAAFDLAAAERDLATATPPRPDLADPVDPDPADPNPAAPDLADSILGDPDPADPELSALRALVRAVLDMAGPDPGADPAAWRSVVVANEGRDFAVVARLGLGWALVRAGERRAARQEFEVVERLARDQAVDHVTVHALTGLGVSCALDGDYGGAREVCSEAVAVAEAHDWSTSPWLSVNHAVLGLLRLTALAPSEAIEHVRRAGTTLVQVRPSLRYLAEVVVGAATFDLGHHPQGLELLREARLRVDGDLLREVVATGALVEHRCALLLGQDVHARQVAAWARAHLGTAPELPLLRAWTAARRGEEAAARQALRAVVGPPLCPTTPIEAKLLETALEWRAGRRTKGREALEAALALAEPGSLLRPFRYADPAVRRVLAEQIGGFGPLDDFAARVIRALRTTGGEPRFTEREVTILELLGSPLSLEELAGDLAVSVNTVKTHVRAIYAKLGVNNRRAAVVAARRLGLA
ncbi:MAG: helix-turn-helix transcriptional regulator, partial [Saccharothrix sp.]|nr:helix-turn-helix transcriptional regulator [Saccharothrix sp.]